MERLLYERDARIPLYALRVEVYKNTHIRAVERDTNLERRDRLISITYLNLEVKRTFESA